MVVIQLNITQSNQYFRLPPPNNLNPYSISLSTISDSKNLTLYSNYPTDNNTFDRHKYHKYPFVANYANDQSVNIKISSPGAYLFYYTSNNTTIHGSFVVDPILSYSNTILPLDAICILTIVPKWMPTINHWLKWFQTFRLSGYNMIHFAPLNKRGLSNSPYSINDQLSFADDLFPHALSETEKDAQLLDTINLIHSHFNIFSTTDIVWNHTSCDSDWLLDHPEAGYNLKTAPHLRSAYELDDAIVNFSGSINAPIRDINHLDQLLDLFKNTAFNDLKLYQFYVLDTKSILLDFKSAWTQASNTTSTNIAKDTTIHPTSDHTGSTNPLSTPAQILDYFKSECLTDSQTYHRFSKHINIPHAIRAIHHLAHHLSLSTSQSQIDLFARLLDELNLLFYREYDADVDIIFKQIRGRAMFLRIEGHGPRLGVVSKEAPLVDTYFTRLPKNSRTANLDPDEMMLANNGWIWNADPLINFATNQSKAYLLRQVIAWGDCVKLRYGNGPEDNPWLWKHQTEYTVKMAKIFHGVRIDNCHSTPIHVAAYLLDQARKINPNLYVYAELFSGSEQNDILFVSQLGINSLIREAMNAWDPKELSRLTHRHGGSPFGSISLPASHFPLDMLGHDIGSDYHPMDSKSEFIIQLQPSLPHALFMDCTHDNETPVQKRTAVDTLSTAAIVAMSICAVGSVKGYDEVIPKLLDIVQETKKYRLPKLNTGILKAKSILYPIHTKLATLGYSEIHVHQERDYISIHRVHPVTHDGYILIARCAFKDQQGHEAHAPIKLRNQNIKLIQCAELIINSDEPYTPAHYIHKPGETESETDYLQQPTSPLLYHPSRTSTDTASSNNPELEYCDRHGGCINGLDTTLKQSIEESWMTNVTVNGQVHSGEFETIIEIDHSKFKPGSIVLYRTWVAGCGMDSKLDIVKQIDDLQISATVGDIFPGILEQLWLSLGLQDRNVGIEIMTRLGLDMVGSATPWFLHSKWLPGLHDAVRHLLPSDINVLLYRSAPEETDTIGESTYNVPGFGTLAYCGLQGFVSVLLPVARNNNLGHAVCDNLRQGDWMIDYIINRLKKYSHFYPNIVCMTEWLQARLELVKKLPIGLKPKYFTIVIMAAYEGIKHTGLFGIHHSKIPQLDLKIQPTTLDVFAYACAMTTFQLYGSVKSTGLIPAAYPYPLASPNQDTPVMPIPGLSFPSLAAGLPHFTTQYARVWGRDVFIAIRGLFIIPGHYQAARSHLVAFGSTLKHGLLPNLLDHGNFPRYNARDAVWFWISNVIDYCYESNEGFEFLNAKIGRRFIPLRQYCEQVGDEEEQDEFIPFGDNRVFKYSSTVAEILFEILDRHAYGIHFREWNAGDHLDHAMKSEGFDINVGIDPVTGFVTGGSRWNCGTWMDKMGDYEPAGTKGVPATPRDGAPIELVGLQFRALKFVNELIQSKHSAWKWNSVTQADGQTLSFNNWQQKIQTQFERHFYIPKDGHLDSSYVIDRPDLINRRVIYKDTFGSCTPYADYQFRPNFAIAMVKAPELFDPEHARQVLLKARDVLCGPLGIKTLDPADWMYRGHYDNNNNSTDPTVAHGFNYHQGPEWVWVMGFFLRAYFYFFTQAEGHVKSEIPDHIHYIQKTLIKHKLFILNFEENPFAGLPELTNANGAVCHPSCPSQAWSTSVMIELVHDIRNFYQSQ
ncbi:glucanotransferase domain of glycogen debranching enzyme-domain-containing protein [Globomyces pollinis-pini]|nr:glucanotransferase domain of glycogen debranching enzyme-domain-containing protein [Globomyces pollinis-pini]